MCEGFSVDDVLALDAAHVTEYGCAIQGVVRPGGEDDGVGCWVYTVGLLDAAEHPEMIVAGFEVGDTIDLGGAIARVGAVHEIQYELDTFNTWHGLKGAGVFRAPELVAVQITMPPELCASGQRVSQPVLAAPGARVD
jgi:hypothetical protein